MIEHDYIMQMIKDMGRFLSIILLKKEKVSYQLPDEENYTETDFLHRDIISMLQKGQINQAENLLFEKFEANNIKHIELALDFYNRLNNFDDCFLESNNFSRIEIEQGLKDIAKIYNIKHISTYLD